jgi:hypothetical protein
MEEAKWRAVCPGNASTSAQDSWQFLTSEGKICSLRRAFTICGSIVRLDMIACVCSLPPYVKRCTSSSCERKTARFLPLLTRSGTLAPGDLSFQACGRFSVNSCCFALFRVPLLLKQPNLLAEVQKGGTLMYARVICAQFRPEQTDEIIQLYRESVVPEHSKQQAPKA